MNKLSGGAVLTAATVAVHGDMLPPDLEAIFRETATATDRPLYWKFLYHLSQLAPGKTMVELGTYQGSASLHFLCGGGSTAVGVDLVDRHDSVRFDGLDYRYIIGDSSSHEVVKTITDHCGNPDIVFVDTGHGYEQTIREYELWRPLVAPGGLMLFDDIIWPEYGCTRWWKELSEAIGKLTLPELHPVGYGFGVIFC